MQGGPTGFIFKDSKYKQKPISNRLKLKNYKTFEHKWVATIDRKEEHHATIILKLLGMPIIGRY